MQDPSAVPVPRGRHAPPLDVRRSRQRERLFAAAGRVFARVGYAEASAEAIAREAGMSKATFYEHFTNKEECILELFDAAAATSAEAIESAMAQAGGDDQARVAAGVRAFLAILDAFPDQAKTVLVEIIGAGPRAARRRDAILDGFAERIEAPTREDAYALVGAVVELAARQLRRGEPAAAADLEPVVLRIAAAVLTRRA